MPLTSVHIRSYMQIATLPVTAPPSNSEDQPVHADFCVGDVERHHGHDQC